MISALTSSEVRMEVEETNYDVDVEDLLPNSQHESVVKGNLSNFNPGPFLLTRAITLSSCQHTTACKPNGQSD